MFDDIVVRGLLLCLRGLNQAEAIPMVSTSSLLLTVTVLRCVI